MCKVKIRPHYLRALYLRALYYFHEHFLSDLLEPMDVFVGGAGW